VFLGISTQVGMAVVMACALLMTMIIVALSEALTQRSAMESWSHVAYGPGGLGVECLCTKSQGDDHT
jgi:hypothetical protein